MRRTTAKVKNLAGAVGIILSLPFSFAVAAAPGDLHASGLAQLAESQSILDAWRDYALADLTPAFSWAQLPTERLTAPSLFDRGKFTLELVRRFLLSDEVAGDEHRSRN